ncbi:MAG TPA: hypothetical protein DEG43_04890, partial [Acidimicrobiaceae bacterium]|nr:hypothetical protein [Acidimicrobiaceae bacterium]
ASRSRRSSHQAALPALVGEVSAIWLILPLQLVRDIAESTRAQLVMAESFGDVFVATHLAD